MPIISLIIPVFNTEQHLLRCIDSILDQSFTDYELILVNDGSTDGSLAICKKYADKDLRVIVIDKPNGGASSARNAGIDRSKGDYICFVDADDYVSQDYLGDLYQDMCSENDIDLVMHGMIQVKSDYQAVVSFSSSKTYKLDDGSLFKDINLFKFCGPCCKLFKRDILSEYHIRFNESIIFSEDFDFFARYLVHCNQVRVSDTQNYFYVSHEGSVSTNIYSFDQEYSAIADLFESLSVLNKRFQNLSLDKQINNFMAYYMSRVLTSVYEPPRPKRSIRISQLKSIDDAFVQLFREYFVPPTKNSRIFKILFVNKCYWLYDMACMMWRWKREQGTMNWRVTKRLLKCLSTDIF